MTAHVRHTRTSSTRILGSRVLLLPGLLVCAALLAGGFLWSVTLGAADITPSVVYDAVFRYNPAQLDHIIIQTVRLPRVVAGVLVGAALAVAGALMQGLTRNPLADSGILGINAGAAFAVVLAVYLFAAPSLTVYALAALVGAGLAAAFVYGVAALGGGASPLRLTLAGVVLTAFVTALTTAILIHDEETLEQIRFWTAGALAGRDFPMIAQTAPLMIAGMVGALLISRQITTISLGEDIAKGLGQNTVVIRTFAAGLVVLLAGGAVALAGPISFVGLVIPHVARVIAGVDYRWIIPYSAVLGALLVTLADTAARLVLRPLEVPVGVMMALVGAPFFIYLARWKVKR